MRVFRVHGTVLPAAGDHPLGRILDITVKKPLIGRMLNYGHFVFESAAQVQGLQRDPTTSDASTSGTVRSRRSTCRTAGELAALGGRHGP